LLLVAMCLETLFLLLAVASTVPFRSDASSVAYAVIVFTAVAMGLRNAVVRKLGVPDLTTTVLTMTLTGLAADSRPGGGNGNGTGTRMLSIAAMCVGAACGAELLGRFGLATAIAAAALTVAGLSLFLYSSLRRGSESVHGTGGSDDWPFARAAEIVRRT
jgi:uncharacterized membrane protein YoaK (UPF0700 family)